MLNYSQLPLPPFSFIYVSAGRGRGNARVCEILIGPSSPSVYPYSRSRCYLLTSIFTGLMFRILYPTRTLIWDVSPKLNTWNSCDKAMCFLSPLPSRGVRQKFYNGMEKMLKEKGKTQKHLLSRSLPPLQFFISSVVLT